MGNIGGIFVVILFGAGKIEVRVGGAVHIVGDCDDHTGYVAARLANSRRTARSVVQVQLYTAHLDTHIHRLVCDARRVFVHLFGVGHYGA